MLRQIYTSSKTLTTTGHLSFITSWGAMVMVAGVPLSSYKVFLDGSQVYLGKAFGGLPLNRVGGRLAYYCYWDNYTDFYNLMEVYLDAAFFPNLDVLDFAQEGHRVEFEKPEDPSSSLVFKGVVFNEMKGAMSSPVSALYQSLTEHLFPTITYHYNSGGDPERIPDLRWEQLKAFHAHHYHPSNAMFMTYGDIPAHEHQAVFQEKALGNFKRDSLTIRVPDEQRFTAPREFFEHYALDSETETAEKTHVVIGWLLGKSTDIEAVMEAHLLSGVLLDNGASPLRHALETTELDNAPSPLCGLLDSTREMIFAAGLEGSEPTRRSS